MRTSPRSRCALTESEFRAIMRTARSHKAKPFRRLLSFLWLTGAREAEAHSARWADVDLEAGAIRIASPKTAGTERIVPLPGAVVRYLRLLAKSCPQVQEFIFVTEHGDQWTPARFNALLRRFADLVGVRGNVSARAVRRGFLERAAAASVDDERLAKMLGRRSQCNLKLRNEREG